MTKKLTYLYETKPSEILDEIVFRHYGNHQPLQLVLNANPGLAKRGPILPEGLTITLPPVVEEAKKYITLWGEA